MTRTKLGGSLVVLALILALSTPAQAQSSPKYDVATETHLKGSIDEVKEVTTAKGEPAIHLMIKTGAEVIEIYLCPNAFLKEMEMAFTKGDQVEVTGSKVKVDDAEVILAKDITKGNDTLVLRDKKGAPVWTPIKRG